jgi:hypothetical protein
MNLKTCPKLCVLCLLLTAHALHAVAFDWHTAASTSPDTTATHYADGLVEIKGFAYMRSPGIWWLAPQPNLRSCCLSKYRCVILAENTLDLDENVVVHLQGNLKTTLLAKGGKHLLLDNVQKMPNEVHNHSLLIVLLLGLSALCIYLLFYKKTNR